jgi:penicillin-binding protein 2
LITELVPSMFHRRLLLLAGAFTLGAAVLAARVVWLGAVKHEELTERADSKLVSRHWTPTVRGRIFDRKGRILAADRASYDLVLPFPVINELWASDRANSQAPRVYRNIGPGWAAMDPAQRAQALAELTDVYRKHQQAAWQQLASLLGTSTDDLADRRREIIDRVNRRYRAVVDRRRDAELKARGPDADPLDESGLRAMERRVGEPIWEQGATHPIATRLADAIALELDRFAGAEVELVVHEAPGHDPVTDRVEAIPGLRVINSGDRQYPLETIAVDIDQNHLPSPLRRDEKRAIEVDGVGVHVLGWMREGVQDEDVARRTALLAASPQESARVMNAQGRDRGFYDPTVLERVGASGVEQSMETTLRGLRGERIRQLDTGVSNEVAAVSGRDVTLTIDAQLQARVQAVMSPGSAGVGLGEVQPWNMTKPTMSDGSPNPAHRPIGTELHGAAVVLDIDSGEVLAMVSTPSFLRSQLWAEGSTVFDMTAGGAFLNRAIARPYPPGSVAKALVLNGAAKRGVYSVTDTIECNGHFYPNKPNELRCWIFKMTQYSGAQTHMTQFGRAIRGSEGLMVSCNIFFFTLGQRLGVDGIQSTFTDFGVGKGWDLGIGWEFPGVIGRPARLGELTIQDAIQMGIGQGPIAWTPMHAANSYATLARMGVEVPPSIIMGRAKGDPRRIGLVPEAAAEALDGLGLAVNAELGSGHYISVDGQKEPTFNHDPSRIWIWGKTGTAAGSDTSDPDGKAGPLPPETVVGDHSWYVVLVGSAAERRPRYVVSVMMEYAGSGGKVSGPICNQIIHALIAEGYLPGEGGPAGEAHPGLANPETPG